MTQVDAVHAVTELATGAAARAGLVVEDVAITPAGRRRVVRVVLDLPEDQLGGVPMDAISEASQHLNAALDATDALGNAPYVLEVSSPGLSRPLTERRHWLRARGRLVEVSVVDGDPVTGRLREVTDDGPVLDAVQAGGAGVTLPWGSVRRGQVQVEFGRLDAPVDGADDEDGGV